MYVGDELVAVSEPTDSLYFITVQSSKAGELRFEAAGETLVPENGAIRYSDNAHAGSLMKPVRLMPLTGNDDIYKIIENDHVIIIRNGERYDVTGKKL